LRRRRKEEIYGVSAEPEGGAFLAGRVEIEGGRGFWVGDVTQLAESCPHETARERKAALLRGGATCYVGVILWRERWVLRLRRRVLGFALLDEK